jgi:gentisate 1,2-dioxygenase
VESVTTHIADVTGEDDRAAWAGAHVRPLWEIPQAHSGAKPERGATLWPWRTMRPLVERACELASPAVAERRVLSLIAPDAKPGDFHTITNLNAGLQILLPGEVARPHRHSMDALRFVLDGGGAVTRVDGKNAPMLRGDLVLTPGWCWHEHWHEGDAPMVWLDVLNVHTHLNLDTFAFEPGPPHDVPVLPPEDAFAHANVVPDIAPTRFSPVFRYPYDAVSRALDATPRARDGSRRVRYVNPLTGGCVMPLLDCWMFRLDAGESTVPFRTSAHAVCAVVSGRGATRTGTIEVAWETNDVFTLPHDTPIVHHAEETSTVFVVSDREVYRRLDLLTETYDEHSEGVR